MKEPIRFLIVLVALFIVMAFVCGSWNAVNWGVAGRAVYLIVAVGVDVVWWYFNREK